jgi:hypothetical protein
MIESAIMTLADKAIIHASNLEIKQLTYCYRFRQLLFGLSESSSHLIKKILFLTNFTVFYPQVAVHFCWTKLSNRQFNPTTYIRNFLAIHNYDGHLVRS